MKAARPTNYEIRQLLLRAAKEAEDAILAIGDRSGGRIRAAQLTVILRELRTLQEQMWGQAHGVIRTGIGRVSQAAFVEAEDLLIAYMKEQGQDPIFIRQVLAEQARQGLEAVFAQAANGIPLSSQVYYTQAIAQGYVESTVRAGMLLQKSAKEIAKDVKGLIRPDTPGGVSYAAFRLARTELNNAFKTAQEQRYKDEPWVRGMQWILSGSHPVKDECDRYAEADDHDLGPGIYPVGKRPHSHPNCLCYLVADQISEDDFIEGFLSGDYDEYLGREYGDGMVAQLKG